MDDSSTSSSSSASSKPFGAGAETNRSKASAPGASGEFWSRPTAGARSPPRSPDHEPHAAIAQRSVEAPASAHGGDLARDPNAMELHSSLGAELRQLIRQVQGYDATIDMLLDKNARMRRRLQSVRRNPATEVSYDTTTTQHVDSHVDAMREVNEDAVAEVERLRRELQRARNDVSALRGEAKELRTENRLLRDKNNRLRSSSSARFEHLERLVAEKKELVEQLDATRRDHQALVEKHDWVCMEHEALLDEVGASNPRRDFRSRDRLLSGSHSMDAVARTSVRWPSESESAPGNSVPPPDSANVGSGTSDSAGDSPRSVGPDGLSGADANPVARSYLDQPVTEALDVVIRKGVEAFMSFQNKKRRLPLSDDDRVYYVCQACTLCRDNPKRAVYVSFSARLYSTHPLHCPGFASYEVPLPNRAKGQLRQHFKVMRRTPGVVVADAPAAALLVEK